MCIFIIIIRSSTANAKQYNNISITTQKHTMNRTRAERRSISEISSCFLLGRDPGTLKSDIVSKKHPQSICSDLRLSN